MNHSFKNDGEAVLVVDLIVKLLNNGIDPSAVTVLTFYEAQRVEIMRVIETNLGKNKVRVYKIFYNDNSAII